ncbi:hypothetical protein JTB14_020299 [Gonioctena quinquepunctata]|nr:hypothetical protein JTB14_020299 [Gonioctena quinquepunctata]
MEKCIFAIAAITSGVSDHEVHESPAILPITEEKMKLALPLKESDLRLEEIFEESKLRQTTRNESIIEQNSSTDETPINKTEEAEEVIVNADFEDGHNWVIEMEEADNFTLKMGALIKSISNYAWQVN